MIPETVKQAVKQATAGLSKNDALAEVARIFDPRITGARLETPGAIPAESGAWPFFPLALKDRSESAGGVRFTAEETEQIRALGYDPAAVAKYMPAPSAGAAVRREKETLRLKAAEIAGPLSEREAAEMKGLSEKAVRGTLEPAGQDRLLGLLDRNLAGRGAR